MVDSDDNFLQACRKHSLLVEILCVLLGINSLIATNGLWMEIPVMVPSLPEGWELPAYLTIIIQIANIGPILYSLAAYRCPKVVTEKRAIFVMLGIGVLSSGCMVAFWRRTAWLVNKERSLALMVLTFFLALVDSTSSIVCLPFMASLKEYYVTFYMIGEGLGGFLPSMVAMAQGVEEYTSCNNVSLWNSTSNTTTFFLEQQAPNPRFSPELFFTFLFCMMVLSSVGFLLLVYLPAARKEHVKSKETTREVKEIRLNASQDFKKENDQRFLECSPGPENVTFEWLKRATDFESKEPSQNQSLSTGDENLTSSMTFDNVLGYAPEQKCDAVVYYSDDQQNDWIALKTFKDSYKSDVLQPMNAPAHHSGENCFTGSFPRSNASMTSENIIGDSRGSLKSLTIQNRKRQPRVEIKQDTNSQCQYYTLLILQGWVSALGYGVFPSIQSYSCLPYGSNVYLLAVVLVSTATPVACLVALFLPTKKTVVVFGLTFIGTVVSVYIMLTAVMSPNPMLVGTRAGNVLVIGGWVLFTALFGYVKVAIAAILRNYGHKALFWCGALTQAGSASGALIMFLLVSVFHQFTEKEPC